MIFASLPLFRRPSRGLGPSGRWPPSQYQTSQLLTFHPPPSHFDSTAVRQATFGLSSCRRQAPSTPRGARPRPSSFPSFSTSHLLTFRPPPCHFDSTAVGQATFGLSSCRRQAPSTPRGARRRPASFPTFSTSHLLTFHPPPSHLPSSALRPPSSEFTGTEWPCPYEMPGPGTGQ